MIIVNFAHGGDCFRLMMRVLNINSSNAGDQRSPGVLPPDALALPAQARRGQEAAARNQLGTAPSAAHLRGTAGCGTSVVASVTLVFSLV